MKIKFLKEEHHYYEMDLRSIFESMEQDHYQTMVQRLLEEKYMTSSFDRNGNHYYQFKYVGLLMVEQQYLSIYPKYVVHNIESSFQDVMLTFDVYRRRNYNLLLNSVDDSLLNKEGSSSLLPMVLFLLEDYMQRGLYQKEVNNHELDGTGEIDWVRTIEEEQPFIKENKPYYIHYFTQDQFNDQNYIVTKIQKWILNECSKILQEFDVLGLFHVPIIQLEVESFEGAEIEYLEYLIQNELSIEYRDDNIKLFQGMLLFLKDRGNQSEEKDIYAYGIRSFHVFWENICSYMLKNQYDELFKSKMPHPNWKGVNQTNGNEVNTIIPDIVHDDKKDTIYLWDAKYYVISFDRKGKLKGKPPGAEDVVKQYVYAMWCKDIFSKKRAKLVNTLVFPIQEIDQEMTYLGTVSFGIFKECSDINLIAFQTERLFYRYREKEPFHYNEIKEFFSKHHYCWLSI